MCWSAEDLNRQLFPVYFYTSSHPLLVSRKNASLTHFHIGFTFQNQRLPLEIHIDVSFFFTQCSSCQLDANKPPVAVVASLKMLESMCVLYRAAVCSWFLLLLWIRRQTICSLACVLLLLCVPPDFDLWAYSCWSDCWVCGCLLCVREGDGEKLRK